jgi:hypothetical protein
LCEEDKGLIRYLYRNKINWQVLLTKSDLLKASDLAACIVAVDEDLKQMFPTNVSASLKTSHPSERVDYNEYFESKKNNLGNDNYEEKSLVKELGSKFGPKENLEENVENFEDAVKKEANFEVDTDVIEEAIVDEDEWLANYSKTYEDRDHDNNMFDESEDKDDLYIKKKKRNKNSKQSKQIMEQFKFMPLPISSATGAGIQELWLKLVNRARETSVPLSSQQRKLVNHEALSTVVREHVNAHAVRRQSILEVYLKSRGKS